MGVPILDRSHILNATYQVPKFIGMHHDSRRLGERSLNIHMSRVNFVRLYLELQGKKTMAIPTFKNMVYPDEAS